MTSNNPTRRQPLARRPGHAPRRRDSAGRQKALAPTEPPGLEEIMDQVSHVLSLLTICQRSLAARELMEVSDEEAVLLHALGHLRAIHQNLDYCAMRLRRKGAKATASQPAAHALISVDPMLKP